MRQKIHLDPDKRTWSPSPLLGQIVFVTTLNEDGSSNIAPKSWISMMAFDPPILALGCNINHQTGKNILARKEFVINIASSDMADLVWKCSDLPHPRPVETIGLTSIPAVKVKPPRVAECRAHLECTLDKHILYGDEIIILGRIQAVEIDQEVCEAADPYGLLGMIVYLEGNKYGVIEKSSQVGGR